MQLPPSRGAWKQTELSEQKKNSSKTCGELLMVSEKIRMRYGFRAFLFLFFRSIEKIKQSTREGN